MWETRRAGKGKEREKENLVRSCGTVSESPATDTTRSSALGERFRPFQANFSIKRMSDASPVRRYRRARDLSSFVSLSFASAYFFSPPDSLGLYLGPLPDRDFVGVALYRSLHLACQYSSTSPFSPTHCRPSTTQPINNEK